MPRRKQTPQFIEQHIASHKDWGRYVNVTTVLHRSDAERADDFLAQMRLRIRDAKRRSR